MDKYYIVKINHRFNTVEYKRYKCSDGFCKTKSLCWKFSKQGAMKIIERLKQEYRVNIKYIEFKLEEA